MPYIALRSWIYPASRYAAKLVGSAAKPAAFQLKSPGYSPVRKSGVEAPALNHTPLLAPLPIALYCCRSSEVWHQCVRAAPQATSLLQTLRVTPYGAHPALPHPSPLHPAVRRATSLRSVAAPPSFSCPLCVCTHCASNVRSLTRTLAPPSPFPRPLFGHLCCYCPHLLLPSGCPASALSGGSPALCEARCMIGCEARRTTRTLATC